MKRYTVCIYLAFLAVCPSDRARAQDLPVPLVRAHAHNDYLHERPLLDALDNGFCSIEADIWLVDGALLVAHDRDRVDPNRTLEKLYLEPLQERVNKNGGAVYPGGPEVILLVDIKSAAKPTYLALCERLAPYSKMLTTFTGNIVEHRAVQVIVSGNRPRAIMESETVHFTGYDGRLGDLESDSLAPFIPLVSSRWSSAFKWRGRGPIPAAERATLRDIAARAHAMGSKVRFWAIPARDEAYEELLEAGVDLINADDLERLRIYLTENGWAR